MCADCSVTREQRTRDLACCSSVVSQTIARYGGYVKLVDALNRCPSVISTRGRHERRVWRESLAEMLPLLFRSTM